MTTPDDLPDDLPDGWHVYQGKDAEPIGDHDPDRWYYVPDDYEGDLPYSRDYPSEAEAVGDLLLVEDLSFVRGL
jgi:hypothetical protein